MSWNILKLTVLLLCVNSCVASNGAFDYQLYDDVLNPELCQQQLILLMNHTLRYQFLDASFRIPSGISTGNVNDLGDYHQCLSIDQIVEEIPIKGKYCAILVPRDQDPIQWPDISDWNITLPDLNVTLPDLNITIPDLNITWPVIPDSGNNQLMLEEDILPRLNLWVQKLAGLERQPENVPVARIIPMAITSGVGVTLAVCIPRVCSPSQALNFLQHSTGFLNFTFNEFYCRLPDDKPFTTVDYVAIAIFSFIGLLIGISTSYDLIQVFYFERASSEISPLLCSFSVYTNTRRLLSFKSSPDALECVDGIRAISMLWVVVGHTYSFTLLAYIHNLSDVYKWITSFSSTWINAAPITVDTFFMLSGVLVVYSTIGKITRGRFIRALHLFYLNRLLRMFPLLAAVVLYQASLINHVADGPFWNNVAVSAENCRTWWWSALLHVQNYVNPTKVCIQQTWYLSVDTQLYYLAPLILWWCWGSHAGAWIALTTGLLLSLVTSSVYSFMYNFSAALANFNRIAEIDKYIKLYYMNTLTRAPPFFVGMLCGYILTVYRDRKVRISRFQAGVLWLVSVCVMSFCVFSIYPVMQPDHDKQMFDSFLNSYMRALWAAALAWIIFACVKGYGGPINWFLSLRAWKLPARLSYAVYLIHVSIMLVGNSSWTKTHYFTPAEAFYRFGSDVVYAFVAAFVLCVCIDAPCSTLQKLILGGGKRKPQSPKTEVQIRPAPDVDINDRYVAKTAL